YTLTKTVNPAAGGTVSASPAPDCGSGTGYSAGTAVTLTASANAEYAFGSWSGCDSSTGLTCQVTMNSNRTVTANFTVINPLVNPGFESGRGVAWAEYSKAGFPIVGTTRPHTGAYSAYFCEYSSCTEYIQQKVTIPSGASSLSYWRYMSSVDSTTTAYDLLAVRMYSSSGVLLTTLRTWSNTSTRNTWLKDTLNISAYKGQTIYLVFIATTNATNATAFFVDDVSIQ
ncbi:MAG: InlB B-repeat-containing protein, partial [Rudaea sp.]